MLYRHLSHPLEDKLFRYIGGEWVQVAQGDLIEEASWGPNINRLIETLEDVSTTELKDDWVEHIYYDKATLKAAKGEA